MIPNQKPKQNAILVLENVQAAENITKTASGLKTKQNTVPVAVDLPQPIVQERNVTLANNSNGPYKTESGRTIRQPAALKDFVKYTIVYVLLA